MHNTRYYNQSSLFANETGSERMEVEASNYVSSIL